MQHVSRMHTIAVVLSNASAFALRQCCGRVYLLQVDKQTKPSPTALWVIQVEKTPGVLLEKPVPLDMYAEKGWQLVAEGFKPFFPSLANTAEADLSTLKEEFCGKARAMGKGMINADGQVEDKHTNLWVTAIASG